MAIMMSMIMMVMVAEVVMMLFDASCHLSRHLALG